MDVIQRDINIRCLNEENDELKRITVFNLGMITDESTG